MATVTKRGDGHLVEWYEPVNVAGAVKPDSPGKWQPVKARGSDVVTSWRKYVHKGETYPTPGEAEQRKRDIETLMAKGERVTRPVDVATATIGVMVDAYTAAAGNAQTRKWRKSMLGSFTAWAGKDTPISDLSVALLTRYAASLPSEGRKASTKHRKVLAVETAWTWAYDPRQRPTYPGVPEPIRVTPQHEGDVNAPVQPAAPVVRTAVPLIEDVDTMRGCLNSGWKHGDDHRKVALLVRYTGLRIAQGVNLDWRDVHLDYTIVVVVDGKPVTVSSPYIVLRSKARGAKKGRTRVVPMHPALAADMATWGVREGRVFKGTNERWTRGEATREAFRTAWTNSGVDPAKWDVPDSDDDEGARGHGSPTHAIRAAVFTALLRANVSLDVASYAIGHATTATKGAYVPEASPEASPWWPALVEAVKAIPDHREAGKVLSMKATG